MIVLDLPLFLGITIVVILVAEGMLWDLFSHKVRTLCFPCDVDTSFFRFFSLLRLRALAVSHAAFLAAAIVLFAIALW